MRFLKLLALPFVLVAMVIVPVFGGHLCPAEVGPIWAAAESLPFVSQLFAWWKARKKARHCCEPGHESFRAAREADRILSLTEKPFDPELHHIEYVRDIRGPGWTIKGRS